MVDRWHDPEGWPPPGQGCWLCHLAPPVLRLGAYALCLDCLCRWFPGFGRERVLDWLERQMGQRIAWEAGREARLEKEEEDLSVWMAS